MSIFKSIVNALRPGSDIVDLEFYKSDLKDIHITEREKYIGACYDAQCDDAIGNGKRQSKYPIGKQVK